VLNERILYITLLKAATYYILILKCFVQSKMELTNKCQLFTECRPSAIEE